jgi:hypothetical protein
MQHDTLLERSFQAHLCLALAAAAAAKTPSHVQIKTRVTSDCCCDDKHMLCADFQAPLPSACASPPLKTQSNRTHMAMHDTWHVSQSHNSLSYDNCPDLTAFALLCTMRCHSHAFAFARAAICRHTHTHSTCQASKAHNSTSKVRYTASHIALRQACICQHGILQTRNLAAWMGC